MYFWEHIILIILNSASHKKMSICMDIYISQWPTFCSKIHCNHPQTLVAIVQVTSLATDLATEWLDIQGQPMDEESSLFRVHQYLNVAVDRYFNTVLKQISWCTALIQDIKTDASVSYWRTD